MRRPRFCYSIFFTAIVLLTIGLKANAALLLQQKQIEETGDLIMKPFPQNKNALFKNNEAIQYKLKIYNNTNKYERGKITYLVTTDDAKIVTIDSIAFTLNRQGNKNLQIKIPPKVKGFYQLNFMVHLPDYDDTVRKVFGVAPEKISPQLHKPADFDSFWKQTQQQLAKVPPRYQVTEQKDLSTKEKKVYLVEMHSYGDLVIRGWLVVPTDGKRFPVHYRLPGYVISLNPNMDDNDYVAFDLNVRGNGNSKDVINIGTDSYCLVNIDDKDKYIYRGVYMDCLRGLDFLCSHANLGIDTSKIFVEGGSQGGALAIVTAALDKRVKALTIQVPLYADIHDVLSISTSYQTQIFPFKTFRKYNSTYPIFTWDKFLGVFDYYDPQNFAPMIKCPVLMGIGLLDQVCPPRCSMGMFNYIGSTSKEYVCEPNATHEMGVNYFLFQNVWLREKLRIP